LTYSQQHPVTHIRIRFSRKGPPGRLQERIRLRLPIEAGDSQTPPVRNNAQHAGQIFEQIPPARRIALSAMKILQEQSASLGKQVLCFTPAPVLFPRVSRTLRHSQPLNDCARRMRQLKNKSTGGATTLTGAAWAGTRPALMAMKAVSAEIIPERG